MTIKHTITVLCDYHRYGDPTPSCSATLDVPVAEPGVQADALNAAGWTYDEGDHLCPTHSDPAPEPDPISAQLKTVAAAVYGERLAAKTPAADVAAENIAWAIASAFWPAGVDEQRALRDRFAHMCLNGTGLPVRDLGRDSS